ncbi:MAG: mannose-1-phosphate guanyltransferase [Candidatus Caldatribacteriota bacterium]
MKAVIMAGGFGTRLRPLVINIPKPMVPVANQPIMTHILTLLKKHNFDDLKVILYHQPELIKEYFKEGKDFGVKIEYFTSSENLGTAGAVALAKESLKETFLVISGDILTDFNLTKAISFHQAKKSLATIVLTRVKNPLPFGIVLANQEGKINRFLEKPSWGEVFSDTINTGVYILEPDIFEFIPSFKEFDFSKNLFPLLLAKQFPLYGYIARGYWRDIGNLKDYREAHNDIINGVVEIALEGKKIEEGGNQIWVGTDSNIKNLNNLKGTVLIGKKVKIGDSKIVNSFIGDGVIIDNYSEIKDSILWDDSLIEKEVKIHHSIICKAVKLKSNSFLEGENVVSDYCEIGRNVKLKHGVSIWPNKKVQEGAIVSSSFVWGETWGGVLFGSYGIVGANNIEITPEFATKLGCAYGTYLGKGSRVFTGRDAHESSRMLKRAIIAGFMGSGVDVFDLRASPLPLIRFAIRSLSGNGGIYVMRSPFDPYTIDIKFFDKSGFDLSTSIQQGIERIFYREEFYRADIEEIGKLEIPPRVIEAYRDFYLKNIDIKTIKNTNLKFVIDYSFGPSVLFFPVIVGDFGLEIVSLNAYMDGKRSVRSHTEFQRALQNISTLVKSLKATLGILLDAGGEKVFVVDQSGEVLSNTRLVAIFTKLLKSSQEKISVTLPVNSSFELEKFLKELSVEINWSSILANNLIKEASKTSLTVDNLGGFIFPSFLPFFDGMFTVGKLIELLSRLEINLTELKKGTPEKDPLHTEIQCPWELKGEVLRKLAEVTQVEELIEGIKLKESDGFIFILPDSDKPLLHLYSSFLNRRKEKRRLEEERGRLETWIRK